ncbi:MAG: hypothetical protein II713_06315 [Clostridia bacterium]|nr:hypothetical protein [Clostridia bacterium]
MKDERFLKDEYGQPAEEFPEIREIFSPPIDEEFRSEAEFPESYELASPGAEVTPPGAPVPEEEEESNHRRLLRKLILYLVAAALGIFMYLGPLGNFAKVLDPLMPGNRAVQIEDLVNPGGPGDPEINIVYAVRDGDRVKYYYIVYFDEFGEYSYDVSEKVITLKPYREAKADPEIDHWKGFSRDPFEHEIDVSSLKGDKQYLFLEGEFDLNGVKRKVSAAREIIDQPPEPDTGAVFTPDYSAGTIDYHAWLLPQKSDKNEYDFEILNFLIALYNETGEYAGDQLVASSANPEYAEDLAPKVFPPDTFSGSETSSGWNFTYQGPANLHFYEEAKTYSVVLCVRDKATGLTYQIESERVDIPQESHVEPSAKIFLTSFYSEFRCAVQFFDLDDVTRVTLEFWNPDTDTLEKEMDLTKEALMFGEFNVDPFTTDFVYENHPDYYEENGGFPFDLIAKVRMEYNWDYGQTRTVEYSVNNVEEIGWEASRTPEDISPAEGWIFPGDFQIQTSYADTPTRIVYNDPEAVGPGVMSVSIRIDGEEISYAPDEIFQNQEEFDYSTLEGDDWVDKHGYNNLLMLPLPEKYKDGGAHVVVFRVTQYISAYGENATFEDHQQFIASKAS